jgi:hypothetical protein
MFNRRIGKRDFPLGTLVVLASVALPAPAAAGDTPPTLSISKSTSTLESQAGIHAKVGFAVTLSKKSNKKVTVSYETTDHSATIADGDYAAKSGDLTFKPGKTTKHVHVTVTGDLAYEGNESFSVDLSNSHNAKLGNSKGVGRILADDPDSILYAPPCEVSEDQNDNYLTAESFDPPPPGDWMCGRITGEPDADFYAYTPGRSGKLVAATSDYADATCADAWMRTRLVILRGSGSQVAADSTGGPGNCSLASASVTSGHTYFVGVRARGVPDPINQDSYVLTVTVG